MTFPADMPLALQLHLWPALLALALGPVALYRRRRHLWHRVAGYAWVGSMAFVAGGAFWLEATVLPIAFGLGPIHLLSLVVLHGLARGVAAARAGDIAAHRGWMRGLYWQALIVAGTLTLLPGRTLNAVIFPGNPEAGFLAIAAVAAFLALRWRAGRRRPATFG
jgi:uncharacterized membrane protein